MITLPGTVVSGVINYFERLDAKTVRGLTKRHKLSTVQKVTVNGLKLNQAEEKMLLSIANEWQATLPPMDSAGRAAGVYGYEFSKLTEVHEQFFNFARSSLFDNDKPVLEIGAAFGKSTHKMLEAGASVIATDLDPKLLAILVKTTKEEYLELLQVHLGRFPDDFNASPNSIRGVLISNVIHYIYPEPLMRGFQKIYRALISGGKLFVLAITPAYGKLNDNEFFQISSAIEDALKNPNILGDTESPLLDLAFPTFIQYIFGGEEFLRKYPTAWIYHPQHSHVTPRYLEKVGFKVDESENFISTMQASDWESFKANQFEVVPRFKIESQVPNERRLDREDFIKFRKLFTKELSAKTLNHLISSLKFCDECYWPIVKSSIGGNMYVIATKNSEREEL